MHTGSTHAQHDVNTTFLDSHHKVRLYVRLGRHRIEDSRVGAAPASGLPKLPKAGLGGCEVNHKYDQTQKEAQQGGSSRVGGRTFFRVAKFVKGDDSAMSQRYQQ